MNIPEKIYVARRFVSGDQVDGYMVDATKDHTKAYQTKKDRADGWAKHRNMPSLMLENIPTKGFAVVQKLSSYNRETYFTVRHPEGFEFQISAKNMNDLIAHNDILKGVFQDEMYFNDNLELINGNTKIFSQMKDKQEKADNRKEIAAALKPGDGFTYGNSEFYYCGKVHAICVKKTREFSVTNKSSPYHLVYSITDKAYTINTKLHEKELVPKARLNVKIKTDDEIIKANEYFNNHMNRPKSILLNEYNVPVLIHNKSFKSTDLKLKFDEIKATDMMGAGGQYHENIVFMTEKDGQSYRVFHGIAERQKGSGYYSSYNRDDFSIVTSGSSYEYFGTYPIEIDDNGVMSMDVDIDTHVSFSTWRGWQSPFYPPTLKYDSYSRSNSYSSLPQMPRISINEAKLYKGKYFI